MTARATNRRENITDWALKLFHEHFQDPAIGKWDIFYYVYAVLHHPGYRAKFADNLKRELPRIPLAPALPVASAPCGRRSAEHGLPADRRRPRGGDATPETQPRAAVPHAPAATGFWVFSTAGKELAHWHLDYEQIEPYPLTFVEKKTIGPDGNPAGRRAEKGFSAQQKPSPNPSLQRRGTGCGPSPEPSLRGRGTPRTRTIDDLYRVEDKMRLSKDKTELMVNPLLTLADIPPDVFEYRLGNRSALDWVIDQYQVTTDKRSGIRSDPNRPDDPQYIVRLVGQVVRVSLETVRLVRTLPEHYAQ